MADEYKHVKLSPIQQMVASCSGAFMVSLLSTPFDVVKVRLQAQVKPQTSSCHVIANRIINGMCYCGVGGTVEGGFTCLIPPEASAIKFTSTSDAFTKIFQNEGLFKLWKGLPATLVMMVPQTVVYFTAYDQLKVRLGLTEGQHVVYAPMVAGMSARVFAVAAISPIEMVRTKLQSKKGYKYTEVFSVIKNAIRQEGILCLWRGMGPTLLRDVPFSAFYWSAYELMKARYEEPTFGTTFAAGASSGMLAAALTTPFDVVKTHRQMELGELGYGKLGQKRLPFTFTLVFKLWAEQGFKSLFTGIVPRLAKITPACAVMISTYEYGKKYFRKKNGQRQERELAGQGLAKYS
ncbi:probable mitochondrial glutathione transporter SLC25A40 [Rhopilema esculentum]|uniref:probable mitochondrial glutathione transporter SLC25A40 n=1 Tax=Rhopilema esculentum TaxID=499914 RepID=UPI0031D74ED5|eukprot:gene14754-5860_t